MDERDEQRQGRVPRYTNRAIYQDMKERARTMRQHPTVAEDALWQRLRRRQIYGRHFRRQHPIVRYIVDFYCAESRLVIEVDGGVHEAPGRQAYDEERQAFLESLDLRVIRFGNDDVLRQMETVVETIEGAVLSTLPANPSPGPANLSPRPPLPSLGEGEPTSPRGRGESPSPKPRGGI